MCPADGEGLLVVSAMLDGEKEGCCQFPVGRRARLCPCGNGHLRWVLFYDRNKHDTFSQ